ncbi:transmembrane protein, putative (macronuclear) [Tetrahymena thermophila SB210]|uniref:Transmembrane protein, putative n=1 Tax=Tetrahymena thermophila (strain SB210) TaxID=312017 RepID=W7XIY3_TETTS|nr:transmembrane protein, putative [Tetrahymena thermophila SB210]EWS73699.1 transmembrane protein, putative [Tetrahymena thermophila SB210]|eukprot:XP_012653737.1 transmembrane protein, putative [Tetrahymena thermophila SB210]
MNVYNQWRQFLEFFYSLTYNFFKIIVQSIKLIVLNIFKIYFINNNNKISFKNYQPKILFFDIFTPGNQNYEHQKQQKLKYIYEASRVNIVRLVQVYNQNIKSNAPSPLI